MSDNDRVIMFWTELEVPFGKSSWYISAFNKENDRNIIEENGYVRLDSDWVPLRRTRSCMLEVFVIINSAVDGCWDI